MSKIRYYFDEMMPSKVTEQLDLRGIEVVMATHVGMEQHSDPEHLTYATENGLVLVTFDRPFAGKTAKMTDHGGLVCLSGMQDNIGRMVRELSQFADQYDAEDVIGHVFWL